MKLSEILSTVISKIEADDFLKSLAIISNTTPQHNQCLSKALQDQGLALVVILVGGNAPETKAPRLKLDNNVLVSVLENPLKNQTGKGCLEVTERVLEALHQSAWTNQRGIQNALTVDTPAYEAGPLDTGLVTYFCNFKVTTIQAVHE
jgi:hypothetical protein